MDQEIITGSEIEWLRIQLSRETNYIEAAKMQKELIEKEALYDKQFRERLKEIESQPSIFGSK